MRKKIRVAQYERVSHEDQKKFGSSIAAQRQHLNKFLDEHPEMVLIDEYCDEGISADKLNKRTELQRMLKDIEEGKIDLVIFTKLDRWFRSVAKYYKIQEILEANNVAWQAVLEDYETVTANGKFKVNIMLSVAQQERDRDSERIKDVFAYKVSQGEAIVPSSSLHFPFIVKEIDGVKRVVHNPETEAMTYDWIEHLKTYNSQSRAAAYINEKYNKDFDYNSLVKTSKDTLLYGCYRGNENYCEPYITKEEFMQLQENLRKNIRVKKNNHVYIFSSKMKCPRCGQSLVGGWTMYKTKESDKNYSYYYKCNFAHHKRKIKSAKACSYTRSINENLLEKKMITNLKKYIIDFISEKEANVKKDVPKNTKNIKRKLQDEIERLNKMYQKGRINEEDYDAEYDRIEKKINALEEEKKESYDSTKLEELLKTDVIEQYYNSDRLTRQGFWNTLVKKIEIDENKEIVRVDFF